MSQHPRKIVLMTMNGPGDKVSVEHQAPLYEVTIADLEVLRDVREQEMRDAHPFGAPAKRIVDRDTRIRALDAEIARRKAAGDE